MSWSTLSASDPVVRRSDPVVRWSDPVVRWSDPVVRWSDPAVWRNDPAAQPARFAVRLRAAATPLVGRAVRGLRGVEAMGGIMAFTVRIGPPPPFVSDFLEKSERRGEHDLRSRRRKEAGSSSFPRSAF